MTTAPLLGVPLSEAPADGVSSLQFVSYSDLLLATSWDGVRV